MDALPNCIQRLCWVCHQDDCLGPDCRALKGQVRWFNLPQLARDALVDGFQLIRADLVGESDSLGGDVQPLIRNVVQHWQGHQWFRTLAGGGVSVTSDIGHALLLFGLLGDVVVVNHDDAIGWPDRLGDFERVTVLVSHIVD